jgi:Tfp pilus assembly pilus retraction ATPase PilT
MQDYKKLLHRILEIAIKEQASDIHFSPGQSPILRIFGMLFPLVKEKPITPEDSINLAFLMMNENQPL